VASRPAQSRTIGGCGFCGREGVPLTPVRDLYQPFRNLASIYGIASDEVGPLQEAFDVGERLSVLLDDHWGVFSEELVQNGSDSRLLTAILRSGWDDDSGEPLFDPRELYVWRGEPQHRGPYDSWDSFRREVLDDPAAEPELPFDLEIYTERVTNRINAGTELFRAVPGWEREEDEVKIPWSVGPPPNGRSISAGRANRQDQRVAYCAVEEQTAVAEVWPAKGNLVSVGIVRVLRDQRIVDLGESLPVPNPFIHEDAYWQIEETVLLNGFSQDLSQPVRRNDDPREYLPSQKLAESATCRRYRWHKVPVGYESGREKPRSF
jgi:RES domain-containing protein